MLLLLADFGCCVFDACWLLSLGVKVVGVRCLLLLLFLAGVVKVVCCNWLLVVVACLLVCVVLTGCRLL